MNTEYGSYIHPGTLRFERLLPGPIERVWAFLTESDKKAKWLADGDIEPRIGGKVELHFYHKNLSEEEDPIPEKYREMENGASYTGRVTQWDPPRLLSYTWFEEDPDDHSEVTYELIPQENDKVLLVLTHRRVGDKRNIIIGALAGWHTHLNILADCLAGNQPKGFWKVHTTVEKDYDQQVSEQ
ncbi:MAG: SRPBCC family protein [Balneolaceae bacterium]|nr:SRPBCC family protein [Balneolaceae bacterium]MDR9409515.1 SRPBCC family protein [Balneolaceae bacterium]